MTTIGAALLGGAWLWDKFGEKVTEQAVKLGGGAGLQAWKKINWKTIAERYRQEMQILYGTMRIIGMTEPVALADIFTDVFLLDKPSAWRRYNIEELKRQLQPEQSNMLDKQRRDGLDLVSRHERLMILGKPGAGKTTLLKHLVLQCTTGKLDAVPIFVGLKMWADSGLALMPFLTRQFAICAFPDAQPFIEHILSEGRAMVLFDGLDEVNLEQGARERITSEVRDLADQYPRSRCVITCRTAASDYQFERFAYCELADFTEAQMRIFVSQWFQRDEVKREAFLAEFAKDENDRLRDLARTPLLLTLLCLTFDETMTFPPPRAEIYEEALDALFKKWDTSRSIKRDTVYRTLSLGHKRQMLARIAAETFSNNELFMRQEDLAERIEGYLRRLPPNDIAEEIDGEAIVRTIEAQHGLLIERAQRIYSFSHLTFHEYFAARYIADHPSEKTFRSIVDNAPDSRWREVLLLTASMLDEVNAETFFETFDASLRVRIQADPALLPMFQWMERKAKDVAASQQAIVRESYFVQALITITMSILLEILIADPEVTRRVTRHLNIELVRDLAQDVDFAQDLDRDLDPNDAGHLASARVRNLEDYHDWLQALAPYQITLDGTRVLVRAFARTLARDIGQDLARAHAHAQALIGALEAAFAELGSYNIITTISSDFLWHFNNVLRWTHSMVRDVQGMITVTVQSDCGWISILMWLQVVINVYSAASIGNGYEELLDIWHHQTTSIPPELRMALNKLTFPERDARFEDWQQFETNLRATLVAHEDIGRSWTLDTVQLERLQDYLSARDRMLECLDLAAVADRDAIRNRLLLPPQR